MSMRWYVVRRILWAILATYLILSAAFFIFAYTPDPNKTLTKFAAGYQAALAGENVTQAQEEAVAAFIQARNYDEPILDRYIKWIVDYSTLDWGRTLSGKPVIDVIANKTPVTLAYLIPAILLALLGGVAIGLYSATHQHSLLDYLGTTVAYFGIGIPHFFLAEALLIIAVQQFNWYAVEIDPRYGLWTPRNIQVFILPTLVLAVNLLAVQARYVRAESLEYMPADFVKTLRASGASTWDVARHILRNASIPLVSLFFTEVLAVLFVTIYVIEVVFGIPGLGSLAFSAIKQRDIGLILATTFLPVLVGVFGNLIQDILYTILDPQIGYGEEE
ncbi:MAG: ABC transporter permease [Halobacteria archaeon]|nr:ABC transporter permease [Halobacteria archaeon]